VTKFWYFSTCNAKESVEAIYKEKSELVPDFVGLNEADFIQVTIKCGLPKYLTKSLFNRCGGSESNSIIIFEVFKL